MLVASFRSNNHARHTVHGKRTTPMSRTESWSAGKHNLDAAVFYYQLLVSFAPNTKRLYMFVFNLANVFYLRRDYSRAI